MTPIRIGLVADPAKPADIATSISDLDPPHGQDPGAWHFQVVDEPFTVGCEDVDTALERLTDHARQEDWDLVVGLTELPLRDEDGRYLLVQTDPRRRTAVLSLPALGGFRMHSRARHAVRELVSGLSEPESGNDRRVP